VDATDIIIIFCIVALYATGGGCVATALKDADHLDQTSAANRTSKHDRGCPSKKRTYDIMSGETGSLSGANMQIESADEMLWTEVDITKKRNCRGLSLTGTCHTKRQGLGRDGNNLSSVDYSVIKAMSQFYLLVRRIKENDRIDLNVATSDEDEWLKVHHCVDVRIHEGVRSPWELGDVWPYNERTHSDLSENNVGHATSGIPAIYKL